MTAAAYRYASGGRIPPELKLLDYIDRFGVEAVMGRKVLNFGEMRRMIYAENLVTAYRNREQAENAAEWVKDNPEMHKVLREAQLITENEQDG